VTKKQGWLPTTAAAQALQIPAQTLRRLIRQGHLTHGKHYREVQNPASFRPAYQLNVENLEQWLNTPPLDRPRCRSKRKR
jgi:hypothetical protein